MKAYEFSTIVTADGKLLIPDPYAQDLQAGNSVRVIVLVQEAIAPATADGPQTEPTLSLDEVVEEIKGSVQNPANIQAGSGMLAQHLADSPECPDPSFDVATWNQQWDQIEAQMKRMEQAEQAAEADLEQP